MDCELGTNRTAQNNENIKVQLLKMSLVRSQFEKMASKQILIHLQRIQTCFHNLYSRRHIGILYVVVQMDKNSFCDFNV